MYLIDKIKNIKMLRFLTAFMTWQIYVVNVLAQAPTVNTGEVSILPNTIISVVGDLNNTPTGQWLNDGDAYIYANWNNDGVVDFTGTTGLTRFIGANTQRLSGSELAFLYDALFLNTSSTVPFELEGLLSISGTSDFDTGIVDNDNFGGSFIFELGGIDVNTSDDSHVDGTVTKLGDESFTYPIGDGGFYRPAAISAPNATTEEFTGKYFFEDTNASYPTDQRNTALSLIDPDEFWQIERATGTTDVLITLSWDSDTTPALMLQEPLEDLRVARWDATLGLWLDEGGVVDTVNQTVTTATNITTYGIFTLARAANSNDLPCELRIRNTLITPNNDALNDVFGIEYNPATGCVQALGVKVFNRWGVKVFESDNYGQNGDVFDGFSDGRLTINDSERLPTGTYFYVLEINYLDDTGTISTFKRADYLYLNGE